MGTERSRLRDLKADDPVRIGAAVAAESRLRRVERWARRVRDKRGPDAKAVHELRVACRRAGAMLEAYRACLPRKRARRVRRLLKALRRSAGAARDLDVQRDLWERIAEESPAAAAGCARLIERGEQARAGAARALRRAVRDAGRSSLARARRKLVRGVRDPEGEGDDGAGTLGGFGERVVGEMVASVIERGAGAAGAAGLHAARIAEKRAQYALDLFRGVLDADAGRALKRDLKGLHDGLGAFHDLACARTVIEAAAGEGGADAEALGAVLAEVDRRLADAEAEARVGLAAFVASWRGRSVAAAPRMEDL
jgi:CHAD domain-containing protein